MNHYISSLVLFFVLVVAALVGTTILQGQFAERLSGVADEYFEEGNYLASLLGYNSAKARTFRAAPELEEKIGEAKELLVAEVNFQKAKQAAEEGDWLETKALLSGDAAMINTSFAHYKEAIDLFLEASEKVKVLEEKIDVELAKLKVEAAEEKERRQNAEQKIGEAQTELQSTIAEKTKTEAVLRGEIEQKKSEAAEARAEAETERLQKFKNELDVYVSMLVKGNGFLSEALLEIANKKDTTALLIVGQAKALFDEGEVRGKDMLAERTPDDLKTHTQKLLQAAALLVDASRRMGTLVFYIGKENESEFKTLSQEISERRNIALQLIQELQNFIQ